MKCTLSDTKNIKKLLGWLRNNKNHKQFAWSASLKEKVSDPNASCSLALLDTSAQSKHLEDNAAWVTRHISIPVPCCSFSADNLWGNSQGNLAAWLSAAVSMAGSCARYSCEKSILSHYDNKNASEQSNSFFFFHITKYTSPSGAFLALQAVSIYTQSLEIE